MGREPGIPEFAFQNIPGPALGASPVTSKALQQRPLWIHWNLGREGPFGGNLNVGEAIYLSLEHRPPSLGREHKRCSSGGLQL